MALHIQRDKNRKTIRYNVIAGTVLLLLCLLGLFIGKYPLTLEKLLSGDTMQWKVFYTLRLSRVIVGLTGGFALGAAGFVYQTVFRNPLASPDIIGVSSGASAGAAVGILFFSSAIATTICSFAGAVSAVVLTLILSAADRTGNKSTIVLAGIAVHSLAQTVLMCLKLTADPEKELAAIEYWIMGSLAGIKMNSVYYNMGICIVCLIMLFMLHRHLLLLSLNSDEARLLGVNVMIIRLGVLIIATLTVSCVVSLTGLISFVSLLAPHTARLITKSNKIGTMLLSGTVGGILLLLADIFARSVSQTELPVSIFTSLLGAPFLVMLLFRGGREKDI